MTRKEQESDAVLITIAIAICVCICVGLICATQVRIEPAWQGCRQGVTTEAK